MKLHRIWAVAYRLLILYNKDFNKLASIFYWPILDLIVFGFMITGIQGTQSNPLITKGLLINIALWPLVNRGSLTLSLSLGEELRSRNIANLFTTPLSIYEWITGSIIEGLISSLFVLLISSFLLWKLFGVFLLEPGIILVPIGLFGFITGIAISFITTSILIIWGSRFQTIIWMSGWAFGLISGIFYPIETLPPILHKAALCFPLHYIFSNIREIINTGDYNVQNLLIGISSATLFFVAAGALFIVAYHRSKKQGLNKLI